MVSHLRQAPRKLITHLGSALPNWSGNSIDNFQLKFFYIGAIPDRLKNRVVCCMNRLLVRRFYPWLGKRSSGEAATHSIFFNRKLRLSTRQTEVRTCVFDFDNAVLIPKSCNLSTPPLWYQSSPTLFCKKATCHFLKFRKPSLAI